MAICLIVGATEAKSKKTKETAKPVPVKILSNEVDSMSYALGVNVGTNFGRDIKNIPGGKINIELLAKGINEALKGDSTLLTATFADEYFRKYITKAQEADIAVKKSAGEKFLAENKVKPGIKTTASGLQYQVITEGQGPKPAATDTVKVHYQGFLIDGTKFDSSVDHGQPISFPLNGVIPGWTEGVQLMTVGSKYKFFIPSELGYGERGAGNTIPPHSTLIFEVELLQITPAAPKQIEAAPAAPKTTKATPAKKTKK